MEVRGRVFLVFGEGEFIKLVEALATHDPHIRWPGRSATLGGTNPIFMSNTTRDSHTGPVGILTATTRERIRNRQGTLVMVDPVGDMALLSNRRNTVTDRNYMIGDKFSWEFGQIEASDAILDKPFRQNRLSQLAGKL
tara:strand:- start:3297 stop:3710 length:414 start_codon:yes stop_codon:yes gene_type:complete